MSEQYVITVVLEGNVDSMSKSMDNAASSQRNVKRATDDANLAFIAQITKYQAMTAALNQTIGGFNKLAGGLDRLGWKEQAAFLRKMTAALEILAGPAEIYLAYLTLTIALGRKDVAVKGAQTAATTGFTAAIKANTIALLSNPLFWMATAIITLIVTLGYLEKEFGKVRAAIEFALNPLERFRDMMEFIQDAVNNTVDGFANLGSSLGFFPSDSDVTSLFKAGA
tara:strand:+ start:976 stop:1650 length:675 start_codon:yes stop_codon:yes gene_type:complete